MSKYTAFRCPIDLRRRAVRIADGENRSLSNYIVRLLEEDLTRRAARDMGMTFHEEKENRQHLHGAAHSARA